MKNLEDLFKEICTQETNDLNEFWIRSAAALGKLEVQIADEKLKERTRQLRYTKLCEDIDQILTHDGYNGDSSDVFEYFSRTHLNYTVRNSYFDIHPKLKGIYNLLVKSQKTKDLEYLQSTYSNIKIKMTNFKHINADILYNSILKAFQELIPEPDYRFNIDSSYFHYQFGSTEFPWTKEAQEEFIDYELVTWYKNNIDEYLCTPINKLILHERSKLF